MKLLHFPGFNFLASWMGISVKISSSLTLSTCLHHSRSWRLSGRRQETGDLLNVLPSTENFLRGERDPSLSYRTRTFPMIVSGIIPGKVCVHIVNSFSARHLLLSGHLREDWDGVLRRDGQMGRLWCGNSLDWERVIKGVSSADKLYLCCFLSWLSVEERAGDCHWTKHYFQRSTALPPHFFEGLHQGLRNLTCSPFVRVIHLGWISSAVFISRLW